MGGISGSEHPVAGAGSPSAARDARRLAGSSACGSRPTPTAATGGSPGRAEAVLAPGESLTALDVGGCGGMLAEFLGSVRVVDLRAGADVDVVGDARRLPFPDRAFDVVCCSDVLEHVPEGDRNAVLAELFRIARRLVVVAGPYRSAEVELAEQALREFHRYCTNGISHHWLDEHMRFGLPALAWLEGELARAGTAVPSPGQQQRQQLAALPAADLPQHVRPRRPGRRLLRGLQPQPDRLRRRGRGALPSHPRGAGDRARRRGAARLCTSSRARTPAVQRATARRCGCRRPASSPRPSRPSPMRWR